MTTPEAIAGLLEQIRTLSAALASAHSDRDQYRRDFVAMSERAAELACQVTCLERDVAAGREALDRCVVDKHALQSRRDELLVTIASISQTTPYPDEIRGWESQRAAMLVEIGTLRSERDELARKWRHVVETVADKGVFEACGIIHRMAGGT